MSAVLAGVIAAGSLINSGGFISDNALGYSEGLATALMLIAVDRYSTGPASGVRVRFLRRARPSRTVALLGPVRALSVLARPGARKLVMGLFALIPVLWFLPELWGCRGLLRGVTRAQHPRANSAAFAKCPVCTVFKKEAWPTVLNRVKIPGHHRAVRGRGLDCFEAAPRGGGTAARSTEGSRRGRGCSSSDMFGLVWWLRVAFETQAGFSGNNRYLVLGTAPVGIAGGIAWGWFWRTLADGSADPVG